MKRLKAIHSDLYKCSLINLPNEELLEPILKIANNKEITKHMEWDSHTTITDTIEFMKFCEIDSLENGSFHFAIKIDHSIVGVISLINIADTQGEITTWLGKEYWGNGYNKLSKHMMMIFAFNKLKLNQIFFKVTVDNINSINSHKKMGSILNNEIKNAFYINNQHVNCYEYLINQEIFNKNFEKVELSYE